MRQLINNKSIFAKVNYHILLWGLILGVILYDYLGYKLNFSYFDEIFVATLLVYSISRKRFSREFFIFCAISIFYLLYSYAISITSSAAIVTDFFIQIKPYIAFYCAYNLRIYIAPQYYRSIKRICIILSVLMLSIGLMGENVTSMTMVHPSRYATTIAILGALYYYCSSQNKRERNITFIIWSIGLLSLKAKFFGFYAVALFLFFIYNNKRIKNSIKNVVLACLCVSLTIVVSWDKISFYFIDGTQAESMYARPYLYQNSIKVLNDYVPFGSGLGTYATHASQKYYSPLYYKYKMHLSHEIGNGRFISDTFYPALAQFGYLGIFLFILFWWRIYKRNKLKFLIYKNFNNFKIILLIVAFFAIESVADSTFVQNRGTYMLVLLAMFLNQIRISNKIKKKSLFDNL